MFTSIQVHNKCPCSAASVGVARSIATTSQLNKCVFFTFTQYRCISFYISRQLEALIFAFTTAGSHILRHIEKKKSLKVSTESLILVVILILSAATVTLGGFHEPVSTHICTLRDFLSPSNSLQIPKCWPEISVSERGALGPPSRDVGQLMTDGHFIDERRRLRR